MAINYELINKGGISLGTNFELLSEKPLDSRLVVPSLDGLQNYIDSAAAYEGMIAYVSSEKKHYEVKVINGVLSYRPFGLTETELNDLITNATTAAMEFKGATATLPENPAKGDMYKVAGENISIKIDDVDAKLGDSIVYDGEKWFLIPSGDDIEDTWRPVEGVNNDATLKFVDGDKTVAAVAADGTIKYNHATVAAPADVTAEGDEKTRTYITAVETDGYGHITGYKTATENVEDTNTEYTFESQVESSSVYFNVTPNAEGATEQTVYVDAYSKNEANAAFKAKRAEALAAAETEANVFVDTVAQDVDGNITITTKAVDFSAITGRLDELEKIDHKHNFADEEALSGITAAKVADWDDAVSKEHTHTFVDSDVEDAIAKKHSHTFTDEDVVDAISKEHTHSFSDEAALNGITAAKVADWDDAVSKEHTHTFVDTDVEDAISKKHSHTFVESELNKIAAGDVAKWNDAQANVIEAVKVNGEALTITDKAVDIAVPTGALAGKDEVEKGDLAEALATEIDNKVAKEDGKSLVLNTEIAKLTGVSEGANKVEASANGKIKIDGVDTTVYAHPDKHTIAEVDGLQDALNGLQTKGDYAAEEHTHTKDEITDFDHTHAAADITDFATEVAKVKVTNAGAADTAAHAGAATKVDSALTVKIGGVDVAFDGSATKTVDIDSAVQGAKDYAKGLVDAIPAQTDYTVTITPTNGSSETDYAKRYTFTQNGAEIGTIDLAKELVVTSGSVKEVTTADTPYAGAKVGDKYIELVIANQDAPIYVPAKDLVDIYTAKDGATEVQVAISNTNEISATLVNGGITEAKLHADVTAKLNKAWEEVGVAAGLVATEKGEREAADAELATAIETAKTEAANQDAVVLSEAQKSASQAKADAIADAATKYETIGTAQGIVDGLKLSETYELIGAETRAIAAAKTETENQVKALADTVYTQAQVDALMSWGEF